MSLPFKILELLSAAELAELETYAREPGRTVDECHEWMRARGFTLARSSVGNWLSDFKNRVVAEKFSASSELARAIRDQANTEGGAVAISEGAILQLSQQIFEALARSDSEPGDLLKLAIALKTTLAGKEQADSIRAEEKRKQAEALAQATKAAGMGASATDVVNVIKRVMGIGK